MFYHRFLKYFALLNAHEVRTRTSCITNHRRRHQVVMATAVGSTEANVQK